MTKARNITSWILGVLFVFAGANHFRDPGIYLRIIPDYLPWPSFLVQISGIAEIVLGILLCFPWSRKHTGFGIISLLPFQDGIIKSKFVSLAYRPRSLNTLHPDFTRFQFSPPAKTAPIILKPE